MILRPRGTLLLTLDVEPMGAPRMVRSDGWKWAKGCPRPSVARYFAFRDAVREQAWAFVFPEAGGHVVFHCSMPKSWSGKRRANAVGTPHRQKCDADNLLKACLDALCDEDKHIWDVRVTKLYGERGRIEVWAGE